MVIDSLSPFIPRTPPAEAPIVVMPDEQTPLLDAAKIMDGEASPHRGYKAAAPENTMPAFRAAVACGAHAVETDLHLSRDGVVVLSHDATLRRCFGVDAQVRDCDWSYLSTLRTLRQGEPGEAMPRLKDLLEYLNEEGEGEGEGREGVWVMLDIKTDDDPAELMRRTAETIASVPGVRPWSERILPCCWTAEYVKLTQTLLPGFPVAHVGVNTAYARALADHVPDLGLSMLAHALATPVVGPRFLRDMRRAGHRVYAWTVDDEDWMRWAVRERLAGVITDDPKLFLEVCRRVASEEEEEEDWGDMVVVRKKEEEGGGSNGVMAMAGSVRARVAAAPGRLVLWIRFFIFQIVLMVVYLWRWGLPSTQVPKVLGS
ncbi:hypothetical protein Hte_010020 [Hypoxylon texense]